MELRFSPFEIITGTGALFLCLLFVCVFVEAPAIQTAVATAAWAQLSPPSTAAGPDALYWTAVEPHGQRVILAGAAVDPAARRLAVERVMRASGVVAVIDRIEVVGGAAGSCQQAVDRARNAADIRFKAGRAELTDGSVAVVAAAARALAGCGAAFEVAAHTSPRGDAAMNRSLSERRAGQVVRALVQHGADPARLRARGYGESQPSGGGEHARIELRVLGALP